VNYQNLSLDELFGHLRPAAIAEYDSKGEVQVEAVKTLNEINREILKRPGHEERYRTLLNDPHPNLRYTAALRLKDSEPSLALATFRDLINTGGILRPFARVEIYGLEDRGVQ